MKPYYQDLQTTIYHGDCRDVLPKLEPVDHVITDPPYARDVYLRLRNPDSGLNHQNRGKQGSIARLKALKAGEIGSIDEMLEDVAKEIGRLTRSWSLVFSDIETTGRWREALITSGLRYVRTGAWVKPDAMPQMSGDRPAVGFEPCTITHSPGKMKWNGGGRPALWTFGTCRVDRPDHPCPKPLPLMQELIRLFTDLGEEVLDPFLGSGTTLVAAKNLGRRAIGIEMEEKYCEIAAKRLAQETIFGVRA